MEPIDRRTFLHAGVQAGLLSTLSARELFAAMGRAADASDPVVASEPFTLNAEGLQLVFEVSDGQPVLVRSLRNSVTGFEWARANAPLEPVVVTGEGKYESWTWRRVGRSKTGDRLELLSTDASRAGKGPVHTRMVIQAFNDTPFTEWRTTFENQGQAAIEGIERFGAFRLPLRGDLGALKVYALPKNQPPQVHAIAAGAGNGTLVEVQGDGDPGGLVLLEAVEHREFLVLAMEWDNGLRYAIEQDAAGRWLTMDVAGYRHEFAPGAQLAAPTMSLGATRADAPGDFEHAVHVAQGHMRRHVLPTPAKQFPWVVYNIWGTEPSGVEETIWKEIDFAAELGVDMMYVDAAWYKGSSKKGTGDWGCGLGSYEEDREKYPRGLAALSDAVHKAGMKFGLWVAPGAADSRWIGSLIPREWLTDSGNGPGFQPEGWEIDIRGICIGNPECAAYVKTNLTRIVKEYSLDWLKWDESGRAICQRGDHGHGKDEGKYAQMQSKYEIFAHLHRLYPNLIIEQCIAPMDYGPIRSVRANWLSDSTFPSENVRKNAFAGAYLLPGAYNGAWVVQGDPGFPFGDDPAQLDTVFRSRMLGAFGFGTMFGKVSERVSLFPEPLLAAARRNIAVYKRYRHLLFGDAFQLSPLGDPSSDWEAIQFAAPNRDEAVVLVFRGESAKAERSLRLRGVTPSRTYEVISINTSAQTRVRGEALLRDGVPVTLAQPGMSEVLLLRAL